MSAVTDKRMKIVAIVLAALALVAAIVAVVIAVTRSPEDTGTETAGEATSTVDTETTATPPAETTGAVEPDAGTLFVRVYFQRGDTLACAGRTIPYTKGVATEAMRQLLAGPNDFEQGLGMDTQIPTGTKLNSVTIAGGIATVDLSGTFESGGGTHSMFMRLAQVVYTLTQFDTVNEVRFKLDGEPVALFSSEGIVLDVPVVRADYYDMLPAIFVESPTPGERVSSPVRLRGLSNVFEATFIAQLLGPSGNVISERIVTATAGTGTWGSYNVTLQYGGVPDGMGTLRVFEESMADGSEMNVVEFPVRITP